MGTLRWLYLKLRGYLSSQEIQPSRVTNIQQFQTQRLSAPPWLLVASTTLFCLLAPAECTANTCAPIVGDASAKVIFGWESARSPPSDQSCKYIRSGITLECDRLCFAFQGHCINHLFPPHPHGPSHPRFRKWRSEGKTASGWNSHVILIYFSLLSKSHIRNHW